MPWFTAAQLMWGIVGGATVTIGVIRRSNGLDMLLGYNQLGWGPLPYWLPSTVVLGGIAAAGLGQIKRWIFNA